MKSAVGPKTRRYSQTVRAQSAEETAQRIVDAFLSRLMTEWFDEITLDQIAKDAGVTVQTVIRRFGGKEGLLAAAVKILGVRILATREAPSGDIDRLIHNLMKDYEETGDPVIRLLSLEPRHPSLKTFTDIGRREHRSWVASAFTESLEKLQGAARDRAIDMLRAVTDVYVWKLLRRDQGHSVAAAESAMKGLVKGVIAEITKSL